MLGGLRDDEEEPLLSRLDDHTLTTLPPRYASANPVICAIFVVAFDTRSGNIIEWNYPESFDLTGVEFRALPSGAHNVQHDVLMFELHNHFGIATYIMKQVDNVAERGARMKSVGLVCESYLPLASHEDKLIEFAQESVDNPGSYSHLIQYLTEHNAECGVSLSYELKPSAVGSLYDLFKYQGINIFVLWKMMLLKKRILIQCTPPISRQCGYVMSLAALVKTQYTEACPIFYVTVNDINTLHYKPSYIACSADLVLKSKGSHVYDVYVTGSAVVNTEDKAICPSRGDQNRYSYLAAKVDAEYGNRNTADIDRMILSYFVSLTEDLFITLDNIMSGDRVMNSDDMRDIRFHTSDLPYLQTLVDKLGYDLELFQPGCCEEPLRYLM